MRATATSLVIEETRSQISLEIFKGKGGQHYGREPPAVVGGAIAIPVAFTMPRRMRRFRERRTRQRG